MKLETLTIKEAIKQGYTRYGYYDREWQMVNKIHDQMFEEIDEYEHDNIVLFEKKSKAPSISSDAIAEILSDHIGESDSEECMRDDDCVYETVSKIDFTDVAEMINKKLEQHKYWMITDVKLKP